MRAPETVQTKSRDFSLDALRGIALLLIIVVHVTATGFYQFAASWKPVVVYGSFGRIGVPIFFMVSGALLLTRTPTPAVILRRIWKIALPLFFWSFCYLLWLTRGATPSLDWIARIVAGPVAAHLWFLYTMIGAYLFLPLLCGLYSTAVDGNKVLVIAAWFVGSSVLPTVYFMLGHGVFGIDFSFMPLYSGYIFLGAILAHEARMRSRGTAIVAAFVAAVGITATAVCTWKWSVHVGKPSEVFYSYSSPTVVLAAAACFVFARNQLTAQAAVPSVLRKLTESLSSCSFGIYLSHLLVLLFLQERGFDYSFGGPWFGSLAITLAVAILCWAFVAVVQRIPYLRAICPAS